MSKPTLKRFAEALMNAAMDLQDFVPHLSTMAGPATKKDDTYRFPLVIHRPRGHPKKYEITVKEIY